MFEWTESCKKAFELLKERLMKPPILSRFEESRKTELHTDASYAGLGTMLLQLEDGKQTMVCAINCKLNDAEENYGIIQRNWTMERFRHYLYGHPFVVVSHCSAAEVLVAKQNTPQFSRWLNRISEFEFTIRHRAVTSMKHVDALSIDPV